jgi:hypothetical protein
MDTPTEWESNATILATARLAVGFEPSEKQRKDWRKAGLLPRPIGATGQGRGHGVAYYPPGTGELLTAICRHSKPKKSLDDLSFLVWWDGFPVEPTMIRNRLESVLDDWQTWSDQWRELSTYRQQDRIASLAVSNRLPEPLRTVRGKVGPRRLEAVLTTLTRVASGSFEDWESSDERAATIEGLGLDKARRDRIGTVAPWLRGIISDQIRDLAATIEPSRLRDAYIATGDDELCQARNELKAFLGMLSSVRPMIESLCGPGAFGVGLLPDIDAINHKIEPAFLLVWLVWRDMPKLASGYQTLMDTATYAIPPDGMENFARDTGTR